MKPWHVHLFGAPISLGRCANVIASRDYTVRMTVWPETKGKGRIAIGDYCLICPGVRISSAAEVVIGEDRDAGPHALRRLCVAQAQAFTLVRIVLLDAREEMMSRQHQHVALLQPPVEHFA